MYFFFSFFKSICPEKSNSWFYLEPPTLFTYKGDLGTNPHPLPLLFGFPLLHFQRDSCFCFTVSGLNTSVPGISVLWGSCIYYLAITAITAKTLMLNLQLLRTRKTTQKSFSCLSKAVDDECMHEKRNQLFPHPFLFFSEAKPAKTFLLEKSFRLVGSGLPFSRFIQAVFMGDSFFRCPASKYSRCGCFLWKEKK